MRSFSLLLVLTACQPVDGEAEVVTITVTKTITNTVTVEVPLVDTAEEPEIPLTTLQIAFSSREQDHWIFPGQADVYMGTWTMRSSAAGTVITVRERPHQLYASPDANVGIGVYESAAAWSEPFPLSEYFAGCALWTPGGQQLISGPTVLGPDGLILFHDFQVTDQASGFDLYCNFLPEFPSGNTFYGFAIGDPQPLAIIAENEAGEPVEIESHSTNGTPQDPDYAVILAVQ